MRILMITGDRSFKPGHPRFDLQAGAVEHLEVLYWGPGALWGTPQGDLPAGSGFFEVVSTQDPFFRGLFGWFWARRFKARLNVQVHADLSAQNFLKRLLARFVLRRANSIRVVSEKLKAQVETLGVRGRMTVLPVFIDVTRFKGVVREPDAQPMILWMGRFEHEKDPFLALHVFKDVREKGIDARLVMLGAGALEARLKGAAAGLPVEFPGWQDPLPYLVRAALVLSTSRAESFGASIIEALAAGVPVVAPDVGVAREAGARIAPREYLADAVAETLVMNPPASLKLTLFTRDEWIARWKESLV